MRSKIENTLYRYAWTFDMDDLEGIGECFTDDAEVEFPEATGGGRKVGRAEIVEQIDRLRDVFRQINVMQWHVISNVFIVDMTDTTALVKTFFTSVRTSFDGTPIIFSIGYYDDEMIEDGDAWRIRRRRVVTAADAGQGLPIPLAPTPG